MIIGVSFPVFRLDSREKWRPVGVEQSLIAVGIDPAKALVDPIKINFPPSMKPPALPLVGYLRVVPAGGLWWRQFWLWWPSNPKKYIGRGEHEGDWELVQFGCVDPAGVKIVLVTCGQHAHSQGRFAWDKTLHRAGNKIVVYAARDSHAMYFAPVDNVTDQADGKIELGPIEWREFGPWASYSGRWGNSDTSPTSPGRQRLRWSAPHLWHSDHD
jgi:hypothetical protein